jgi:hypothetical protein
MEGLRERKGEGEGEGEARGGVRARAKVSEGAVWGGGRARR